MSTVDRSRVVLEISRTAFRNNYDKIAHAVSPLGIIAVVKADAYGMGTENIVPLLAGTDVKAIAVAELSEAEDASGYGLPVIILGTVLSSEIPSAVESGIQMPLSSVSEAKLISECAVSMGRTAECHIALDTGMGRVGFRSDNPDDICDAVRAAKLPGIKIAGMFSHFPSAYLPDAATTVQISEFMRVASILETNGIPTPWKHIANSDAINNLPAACRPPFTHVRTGINLYGYFDDAGKRSLELSPALSIKAKLAQVRTLPAGATVGYGRTYVCSKPTRVGTVAAGYADGLPVALSNRGVLVIRGKRCKILGRVCMDYTMVSLDQSPDAVPGDDVYCVGGGGETAVSIEDWAALKGTHPYEIVCSVGSRVRRRLTD